jgi:hypothetical protein
MAGTETKYAEQRLRTDGDHPYRVWLNGSYAGSVLGSNPRDARIQAARVFMTPLREVSVLPPF